MGVFTNNKWSLFIVILVLGIMTVILVNTVSRKPEELVSTKDIGPDTDFVQVDGISMEPTFNNGDVVFYTTKFDRKSITEGKVIIFLDPKDKDKLIIKRVVATNAKVTIKDNVIYVDGFLTPYGTEVATTTSYYIINAKWDVGSDSVFVVGDNYNNSIDSRSYGSIPISSIVGVIKE